MCEPTRTCSMNLKCKQTQNIQNNNNKTQTNSKQQQQQPKSQLSFIVFLKESRSCSMESFSDLLFPKCEKNHHRITASPYEDEKNQKQTRNIKTKTKKIDSFPPANRSRCSAIAHRKVSSAQLICILQLTIKSHPLAKTYADF